MAQMERQTVISHPLHLNFVQVECCSDLQKPNPAWLLAAHCKCKIIHKHHIEEKKYTFYEIYTIVFFINMLSIVVNSPKANVSLPSASEIIKFCDSFLD